MSMAFFEHQDQARRNTSRLIMLFVFSVTVLVLLTYGVLLVVFNQDPGLLSTGDNVEDRRRQVEPVLWNPHLFFSAAAGTLLVIGGGSLYKIAQLSSGGKSVALLMGGREISHGTQNFHQKRLLNVVEEMAIAAGVPVPAVYLLPDEMGINAFAAGYSPGDAVVAVSQGTINYLTRDELQGVVAHEFSHILNGDMRLNIRLMGLIHGIIVVSLIGLYVMDAASRSRSSNSKDNSGGFLLVGLGLYLIGIVGAFFGQMIQAAISRQREFLADASAVQFTRNPDGIAGALKKIGGLETGSTITNSGASEASHMFFAQAVRQSFTQMWATHPPLGERIRRIDPNWDGAYPRVKPLIEEREEEIEAKRQRPGGMPTLPGMPQVPLPVVLGLSEAGQLTSPGEPPEPIPSRLAPALEEPFSARAVIYALLLDRGPAVRDKQLALLAQNAAPKDLAETKKWEAEVQALPEDERLAVAHRAIPALRRMSPNQYQVFRKQVEQLIAVDKRVSLFEFCLKRVVIYHLDVAFGWRMPPRPRYRSAGQLSEAILPVLALLAWEGASGTGEVDGSEARKAFADGFQSFLAGRPIPTLMEREAIALDEFGAALDQFSEATPAVQKAFLQSCLACIMSDGVIVPREKELLRAICSTLNCPMPPLPETRVKPA